MRGCAAARLHGCGGAWGRVVGDRRDLYDSYRPRHPSRRFRRSLFSPLQTSPDPSAGEVRKPGLTLPRGKLQVSPRCPGGTRTGRTRTPRLLPRRSGRGTAGSGHRSSHRGGPVGGLSRGWRRKAGDEGERRRKSEWRGRGGSENAQSYRVRRNRACERTRLRPCIGGGPGVAIGTTQQPTQPRRTCGAEHGGPGTGGPSAVVAFQRLRQGTKCACLELIARALREWTGEWKGLEEGGTLDW